jgi:hypothetical protein
MDRVEHVHDLTAKTVNDTIEPWYIQLVWASGNALSVTPKEAHGIQRCGVLHRPSFGPTEGIDPENRGGYITVVTGRDEEYPGIRSALVLWEGLRQTQKQLNRRIFEICSPAEPLNAKFAEFLAQYSKHEMLGMTVGLAPADVGCYELWAIVLHQAGRRMTHTAREAAEKPPEQTAVERLIVLNWEHPSEKTADPPR